MKLRPHLTLVLISLLTCLGSAKAQDASLPAWYRDVDRVADSERLRMSIKMAVEKGELESAVKAARRLVATLESGKAPRYRVSEAKAELERLETMNGMDEGQLKYLAESYQKVSVALESLATSEIFGVANSAGLDPKVVEEKATADKDVKAVADHLNLVSLFFDSESPIVLEARALHDYMLLAASYPYMLPNLESRRDAARQGDILELLKIAVLRGARESASEATEVNTEEHAEARLAENWGRENPALLFPLAIAAMREDEKLAWPAVLGIIDWGLELDFSQKQPEHKPSTEDPAAFFAKYPFGLGLDDIVKMEPEEALRAFRLASRFSYGTLRERLCLQLAETLAQHESLVLDGALAVELHAYLDLITGHLPRARRLVAMSMRTRRTNLSDGHPDLARSLMLLGWIDLLDGKLSEGREALQRARTLYASFDKSGAGPYLIEQVLRTSGREAAERIVAARDAAAPSWPSSKGLSAYLDRRLAALRPLDLAKIKTSDGPGLNEGLKNRMKEMFGGDIPEDLDPNDPEYWERVNNPDYTPEQAALVEEWLKSMTPEMRRRMERGGNNKLAMLLMAKRWKKTRDRAALNLDEVIADVSSALESLADSMTG